MTSCCIVNCKSTQRKGDRMFRVPIQTKDPKWLTFCNDNAKKSINVNSRVCEKHFKWYLTENGHVRRSKYPTIVLPDYYTPATSTEPDDASGLSSPQIHDPNTEYMHKCIVPKCEHNSLRNSELNFFLLPAKESVKSEWKVAIKKGTGSDINQDVFDNPKARICSAHFRRDECKEINRDGRILTIRKSLAIPSLFTKKLETADETMNNQQQQKEREISISEMKVFISKDPSQPRWRKETPSKITKETGELVLDEETLLKCRICFKATGLDDLTLHSNLPKSKISLHSAILKAFNFDLSLHSTYPMRVCARCFNLVVASYVLKLEVIKTSTTLAQLSEELKRNPEKKKVSKELKIVKVGAGDLFANMTVSTPQSPEIVYIQESQTCPSLNRFESPPIILNSTLYKSREITPPPTKKIRLLETPNTQFQKLASSKTSTGTKLASKPQQKQFTIKKIAPTNFRKIEKEMPKQYEIISEIKEEPEEIIICEKPLITNEIMSHVKEEKNVFIEQNEMTIVEEEIFYEINV